MHNVTDAIDLTGRVAVAAVDFHSTRIYALDSPDHSAPEHVVALSAWIEAKLPEILGKTAMAAE